MCEWIVEHSNWINPVGGYLADILKNFLPIFLGIWLSVKLALKKFVNEKIWERKVEAYEKLIFAVQSSFPFFDENLHADSEGIQTDEAMMEEIKINSKQGDQDIVDAEILGTLRISQPALDRLKVFRSDKATASNTTDWSEYLANSYDAHKSCRDDLVELAKKDLGIAL